MQKYSKYFRIEFVCLSSVFNLIFNSFIVEIMLFPLKFKSQTNSSVSR